MLSFKYNLNSFIYNIVIVTVTFILISKIKNIKNQKNRIIKFIILYLSNYKEIYFYFQKYN